MAAATPPPTRPPLVLDELLSELTWPILWKAGKLALRPARVGIAVLFIFACLAISSAGEQWIRRDADHPVIATHAVKAWEGLQSAAANLANLNPAAAASGLLTTFVKAPADCLLTAPVTTLVVVPLILLLTAITGGAIARSAATELAWARPLPWPTALAMGLSRWRSLIGSLVLPLGVIWVAALALACIGWALFSTGILSIFGGLLWLVFLGVAAFVALIMFGLALGHWMLIPAVVCEGADAIDAAQHTLSMVFARPLRLLFYLFMLILQGLLLGLVVWVIIAAAIAFAKLSAQTWLNADHRPIIEHAAASIPDSAAKGLTGAARAGGRLVYVSTVIFNALGYGVMISYAWCAATALFLAMRRVCDGQDVTELWSPGMIEGTTSASLRADAAAAIATPRPPTDAITDNGPADEG